MLASKFPMTDSTKMTTMHATKLVLLAMLTAFAAPSFAQWQWVDAQGRKVFSDRAPPPDIPTKSILRSPAAGARAEAPPPAAAPAQPAAGAASAAKDPDLGKDPGLEAQKRKAEEQEAAKEKAAEAQRARQRQDNCERAQRARSALGSGQLLSHTNAQGERSFMDEATRQAELQRAEAAVQSECAPR